MNEGLIRVFLLLVIAFLCVVILTGCGDAAQEAKVTDDIIADAERACNSFGGVDKFYFDGRKLEDLYCQDGHHFGTGTWKGRGA